MQKYWFLMLLLISLSPSYSAPTPVLLAVGDISTCGNLGSSITANIIKMQLEKHPQAQLALLGDIAYERGTTEEFKCFDAAYGTFKSISYPTPGNHEYYTQNASGYYDYYGTRAGNPKRGYYQYKLGTWTILVLNSNCAAIGGCKKNSPQAKWLLEQLQANRTACTLAYWHHPRFSSGRHGNTALMQDIWSILAKAKVDVVLAGHDHIYERFKALDSSGKPNLKGIRSFVIGTGGRSFYPFLNPNLNSAKKQNSELGIAKFILEPNAYRWEFISAIPRGFTDQGSAKCS